MKSWSFQSYGANIRIETDSVELFDITEKVIHRALLSNVKTVNGQRPDITFEITKSKSGIYRLAKNGEYLSSGKSRKIFFKFFDTVIRVSVGEQAKNFVFLHAGAVGWKGRAIVMPGDSFTGKSTLVSALVKNGAEYYSDDFAILDKNGLVHAFPRTISMRTNDGKYIPYELTVDQLGGSVGSKHIPVGMVLLTRYASRQRWNPKFLSPGKGILEMIPYILTLRPQPEFSLKVLNNIAEHAIIAASPRGNADHFAKTLLGFFDKKFG
jgi:hypothetical protein